MKLFCKQSLGVAFLTIMIVGTACGQKTKIKTITIIDGDTTVNEEIISDKTFAWSDESDKKDKKAEVMKIITSDDDSTSADTKMKVYVNGEDNDKKSFTKKVVVMDDGGKVTTIESENNSTYEYEIDEKGGIGKKVFFNNSGTMSDENSLHLKNININIDVKTQILKLDLASESSEIINIAVMDENGKQVFYDSQKQGNNYKKEIRLCKKGVYFLSIIQNKKVLNERIVVE